ncbi:MAG: hypothetical protein KGJ62_05050 [Armatimonadetes bacterium]|nr:hypothetical protein [Armatimonadota bacterium]MDE2205429.1 hypothetical protein [Armatimonadota bacterium]
MTNPATEPKPRAGGGAAARMYWTRERGTARLLAVFVALIAVWYVYGQIRDHILLEHRWPVLQPDAQGLTVVGTLDSQFHFDRNIFKVVLANKASHVELTDFGWHTVFGQDTGLFSDTVGNTISSAIMVDDAMGFAMLTPFLRATIRSLLGDPHAYDAVTASTPITVVTGDKRGTVHTTLGALIHKFEAAAPAGDAPAEVDSGGGGGSGGHQVSHGVTVPGSVLLAACPVVLTGAQFTHADLEEHAASILEGPTYTVHLYLTPEGRSRFYQWSRVHANEDLCFIVNGTVETAGRVAQALDVNDWEIGPMTDEDAAHALTNYVNRKHG